MGDKQTYEEKFNIYDFILLYRLQVIDSGVNYIFLMFVKFEYIFMYISSMSFFYFNLLYLTIYFFFFVFSYVFL